MRTNDDYKHSDLTSEIISCAYSVYNYLGFGFLESVYEKSLVLKLREIGYKAERQVPIKVYFEGKEVGDFRADIVVDNIIIIEIKAVESIHPRHEVQLVNYLKSTEIEIGLLINFGDELKIKRKIFSNERKRGLYRIP